MYAREANGNEMLIPVNNGKEDMDVKKQWRLFGLDAPSAGKVVTDAM